MEDLSCTACFGMPFLSLLLAQVSLCWWSAKLPPDCTVSKNLNFEHSPVVSLENVRLLDLEAQVSLCELDHLVLYRLSPD